MEIVLNIGVPCLMHVLPCDHFRLAELLSFRVNTHRHTLRTAEDYIVQIKF